MRARGRQPGCQGAQKLVALKEALTQVRPAWRGWCRNRKGKRLGIYKKLGASLIARGRFTCGHGLGPQSEGSRACGEVSGGKSGLRGARLAGKEHCHHSQGHGEPLHSQWLSMKKAFLGAWKAWAEEVRSWGCVRATASFSSNRSQPALPEVLRTSPQPWTRPRAQAVGWPLGRGRWGQA